MASLSGRVSAVIVGEAREEEEAPNKRKPDTISPLVAAKTNGLTSDDPSQ